MFGQNVRKRAELGGCKLNPRLRGKCTEQNPDLTTHRHIHTHRTAHRDGVGEGEGEGETDRESVKVEREAVERQRWVSGENDGHRANE